MTTCNHPTDERYFTDDNLLEWCGLCGEVVTDHHERKFGEPHPEHFPKRGPGRPRFDPDAPTVRTTVRLTQAQVAKANRLGDGNTSAGVRLALEGTTMTTTEALQLERMRRNRAFFAARRKGKSIEEATIIANERELYAASADGEVFEEGNGGRWQTSGGMEVFVAHNPTKYVRLPNGEVRFAID